MHLELSPQTVFELQSYAYSAWSKAYDNLKVVKAATWKGQGKFCPKSEWSSYHSIQLSEAIKEEAKTKQVLDEIVKYQIPVVHKVPPRL